MATPFRFRSFPRLARFTRSLRAFLLPLLTLGLVGPAIAMVSEADHEPSLVLEASVEAELEATSMPATGASGTFTASIPEASAALLGGLGIFVLLGRRRA